ncbi:MAG: tripartite tricarboxylate transporter substrate binding protein [Alphaproteobacteria bacterium]|nr:tripartite tricarboxylate transporter substrate binding protein [Alphaproteobacteria bacterium]
MTIMMLAVLAFATGASAAEYPDHPLRFIVPFPPGGSSDLVGRVVTNQMSSVLGQPIVVENHAGAGGRIGVNVIAKAPPDGYTFGIGTVSTLSIAPVLYKDLPYDPLKSLAPIGTLMDSPVIMVVNADVPAKTVAEFIALAKVRPGKLNFATLGPGTLHDFAAEDFSLLAHVQMLQVPYTGAGPAVVALLAGEAQVMFDNLASFQIANITSGKLRALVIADTARLPQLPAVPDATEAGLPEFLVSSWFGLVAPAGTPPAAIVRLNAALRQALKARPVLDVFDQQAVNPGGSTPEALAAKITSEINRWSHVVEATGFTLQ